MPFTVNMPKLSPTMEEGTIVKWHVKEGDKVTSDQVLLEIATDKATVEHNALDEGYLRKILVPEGGVAKVNQPIAIFSESKDEDISGFETEKSPLKQEEKPQEKQPQDKEKVEKAPTEAKGSAMTQPSFPLMPPLKNYSFKKQTGYVKATPLAKKKATEQGINLSSVQGSGPNGRVVSKDLEAAMMKSTVSFEEKDQPSISPGTYEEIPMNPIRKVVATRMQQSKTFIPHFYVYQQIDAGALVEIRSQLKEFNLNVTFNDFVLKATALALKEHPAVNAGFHVENQAIVRFKTIDISVAVTIDDGLITPILRHVDFKTLAQISVEVKSLAKKAREQKLQPEEYQGGSFTVSNLGMFGISDFIAVINPPQAAILAVGGIEKKPIVKNEQIQIGHTMGLTLSVDHRVVDGSIAAQFVKTVQKYLENPASLLLH